MTDTITLTGLRLRGHHGVYAAERTDGQEFVIDVTLEADLAPAAASDNVAETVDYGELSKALADVVAGEPVLLIETLARRLAAVCLAHRLVHSVTVTVHKPQAPLPYRFDDVSVTIHRRRSP